MKERKTQTLIFCATGLVISVAISAFLVFPIRKQRGSQSYSSYLPAPATVHAAEVNPWTLAVQKVKEDRGEATGKQAKVEIPSEVKHYSDTRRFLAIQVAEAREHHVKTPQDFVDLADMLNRGEMVTMNPVTENYILLGVGGSATDAPFSRYQHGKSISLFNDAELAEEYGRLADSRLRFESQLADLRTELKGLGRRARSRRSQLKAQISETEKKAKAQLENKELLDRYYASADTRETFQQAYASLESVGKSYPDRSFDISDRRSRQQLKVRMLSSLRPEAVKVLEEIAASYSEKFQRPLPITSLVRPDEYQHQLSKTNPNATLIDTPPHSTGLAFDIYYRYMTAEEQVHVMHHLAKLKDAGRIEVLRENRDHYHVFAFIDGARPDESFIRSSLGGSSAGSFNQSEIADGLNDTLWFPTLQNPVGTS